MQAPISSVFLAWMQKHGVIVHGIEAAFVEEGWRGVAATHELPAGKCSVRQNSCTIMPSSKPPNVSHSTCHAVCSATLIAGALLLQVPEAMLMTTASAARDLVFGQAVNRYAHSLTPEQVRSRCMQSTICHLPR